MYSTHNEGKFVVVQRFIRTLKNKTFKYITSMPKNLYIDKLDDIVSEYNNRYHRKIKMNPIDATSGNYIEHNVNSNDKDPKFQDSDHVRISKYKNIFAKGYIPNWSEGVFVNKKVKNTVSWIYVINHLNGEKIIGTFYEKTGQNKLKRIQDRKSN